MKSVITHACCIILCIFVCVITAQDECTCTVTDQTAPEGYEWISSGMEDELCYDIDLAAEYCDKCRDDGSNEVQGNNEEGSSSDSGGSSSSRGSSRRKRDDNDQAREDRSTSSDSAGTSDDECVKEICCQGDLVYALVNTSCLCPPEVNYTESSPYTEKPAVTTVTTEATPTTEGVPVTEETTTIEMTDPERMTMAASTEVASSEETTTIGMTTPEALPTIPIEIAQQEVGNAPVIKEDAVISAVDSQGGRDESSNDESSDSEDESDEDNVYEVTSDGSSGNYSMTNDTEGIQVVGEGERCDLDGGSVDAEDNGESGEDESSDSKSDSSSDSSESSSSSSSSTGVARVCQEGLVCTPIGNGKGECRPATTTGQPLATTLGIIIDPAIAQNQVPERQNVDVNFVSGVPGPEHSSIKMLLFLFVLIFIMVLY